MSHVHIPSNALVLVGDGRKALFLRNKGTPRAVELIVERELRQDNSRTAIGKTDWHDRAEEKFASEIAATLYEMEHSQKFDELVVVAPPKMLGDLRAAFHPEVADCVVAEVPKDLTAHPVPELAKVLS